MKRLLRVIIALIVLALCVAAAAKIAGSKEPVDAAEQTERSWRVHSVVATLDDLSPVIDLYGTVTTSSQATLTSAIVGDVQQVNIKAGDQLASQQTLIQLDDTEARITELQAQAQYHEAHAALTLEKASQATERSNLDQEVTVVSRANKSLARIAGLHQRGLASQSDLDNAKDALSRAEQNYSARKLAVEQQHAKLKSREASLARAEAAMQRTTLDRERATVKAPFDAYVVNVAVSEGDRVSPGQVLATVYGANDIEVKTQIPNRLLGVVREATDAARTAGTQALGLQAFILDNHRTVANARISRLAHNTGAGSGGVNAWLALDQNNLELGRHLHVRLLLPKVSGVLAVNTDTVYGLRYIYKIDSESRLVRIPVEILGNWYRPDGKQMILVKPQQLQSGERILAVQLPNAASGMLVDIGQASGFSASETPAADTGL